MDESGEAVDELLALAEQNVGRVLREKWRLDSVLGVGGMGAVFAATHRNGNRGAVKLLHAALTLSRDVRTRFMREGYAANQVNHPGAVHVIDDDEDQGAVFLVMELLEGETLEQRWLRNASRLPPAEVLAIADQVLDVLAAAHSKGIIHRDLKPENLFLTKEGRIKVLDFGIARLRYWSTGRHTRTGGTFGTPAYMPPEQALGHTEEVDAKSDLWSLGATLFALASGRLVHEGKTINEQLLSAMTAPAPPLESVAPDVPGPLARIVDRALCRDKAARFMDAVSMQEAVREAYDVLEGAGFDDAPTVVVWRRRDELEPQPGTPEFDDSPTVIVADPVRPSSSPQAAADERRSSTPPWSTEATAAGAPRMSWRSVLDATQGATRRRVILASAAGCFAAVTAISLLLAFSSGAPKPTVTAPLLAPPRPPRRAAQVAPPTVAPDNAARGALSVTDLPRETDDDPGTRPRLAPTVAPALASAIARAADPPPPPPPPPPVVPREVHLDDGEPELGSDVENPYGPTPPVTPARSSLPAAHASFPAEPKKPPTAAPLPSYGPAALPRR